MAENWNDPLSNPGSDPAPKSMSSPDPAKFTASENNNITDSQKEEYLEIGRISKIRKEIDPDNRISTQLKKRMSVIDLIPCNFKVDLSTILSTKDLTKKFKPTIEYKTPIDDFASTQWSYGLKPYAFLRLYLTDMTSASDDMSNEYGKNIIDSGLDSLTSTRIGQLLATANKYWKSTGSADKQISDPMQVAANTVGVNVNSDFKKMLELSQAVLTHGSRISFPKIWNSSSYSPNLSCVVKLMSPYGHPKAINEFIIKPIAYLMILLSPTTIQGLITQRPNYLTLKSYGLNNMTLCYPRSINIRRGGDDSSFNAFNQPLTVEISLTFEAVTEGFACFTLPAGSSAETQLHEDGQIFAGDDPITDFSKDFNMPSALFPTLKNMVNSFRPFGYQSDKISVGGAGSTGTSSNLMNDIKQSGGSTISEPSMENLELQLQTNEITSQVPNINTIIPPENVCIECSSIG